MVQLEAEPQQQAPLEHAAGHRRIPDRTEQNRVMCPQFGKRRIGQQFPGGVEAPRSQVVIRLVHAGQYRGENLHRFGYDLRSDAVTGDDRQFHVRSTTSSLLAATAEAISERTSAGTSRSNRSRIVAPGPSASSDS